MVDALRDAIIMTVIVIFLFLADMRGMLLTAVSIPFTYLITFGVMWLLGFQFDMVTLTGVILGVGMLLDDAIVVLENIERHYHTLGKDMRQAVIGGTQEVMLAILSGTYATVVVLIPIIFIGGFVQTVLRPLALTLSIALAASYVVSVTIIPIFAPVILRLGGRVGRSRWEHALDRFVSGRLLHPIQEFFVGARPAGAAAQAFVPHPGDVAAGGLGPCPDAAQRPGPDASHGYRHLPGFVRGMAEHIARAEAKRCWRRRRRVIWAATGRRANLRDAWLRARRAVLRIGPQRPAGLHHRPSGGPIPPQADALGRGTESSRIDCRPFQACASRRPTTTARPPCRPSARRSICPSAGPTPSCSTSLRETLTNACTASAGSRRWYAPGASTASSIASCPIPDRLALYGLDSANVASQVSAQVKGIPATLLRVPQQDSFAVWVQSRADRRASDSTSRRFPCRRPKGPVPLSSLGQIVPAIVPTLHTRQGLQETVDVLGYRTTAAVTHINANVEKALQGLQMPPGYSIHEEGERKTMDEAFGLLIAALLLGLILLYFSLVPAFNSFLHPITIMVAIPLALIGATWSMLLMGKHSCMPAFMGMILLAGIVVKNSILLIDFIEEARRGGATIEDALVSSVRVRTRPILMTAAATAVGMIPIAGEWAIGLERLSPLAVVAIGGLLVSTLLTLIYVPMFYDMFEKLRAAIARRFGRATKDDNSSQPSSQTDLNPIIVEK